ncbi:hypothetical protein M0805_006969 [Coniferiporia weirii]|nr:hypothetical protein M0805_006969 [Coniferiporia weirii]
MSSLLTLAAEDGDAQRLKREEALHRSLRECTTRRLTHFFPCGVKKVHEHKPLLTSRVQWSTGYANSEVVPVSDNERNMRLDEENDRHAPQSPVPSEMDGLIPSDGERSSPYSRPLAGALPDKHRSAASDDGGSIRSYSDSSDTETRQPSFPGNRDIIDPRYPSSSPSPPTQHSAELETPSPISDIPKDWRVLHNASPSSALDLRLFPNNKLPSQDDRNHRIGSWRVSSAPENYHYERPTHRRYGSSSDPRPAYSPPISASSAPPSPPPVLPPISHLNATLPVNTGRTPGVLHWRFREPAQPPSNLKRLSPLINDESMDEFDAADTPSSSASPQVLPPLLPHTLSQSYPPRVPMPPPTMPMAAMPQPTSTTRNKNAWKEHTQLVRGANDQTEFRCVWRVGFSGELTDLCGYTAKRHLVKRHIETRHLQFKDHTVRIIAFIPALGYVSNCGTQTAREPNLIRVVMKIATRRLVILRGDTSIWLKRTATALKVLEKGTEPLTPTTPTRTSRR